MAVIALAMIACDVERKSSTDISQYYLSPPTGIVATILSDERTAHITWNAVPNAGSYEIRFRTNLDSADTRRSLSTSSITRYEHSYSYWWINFTDVDTIYYYLMAHPNRSGYIASGWSDPVSVKIR